MEYKEITCLCCGAKAIDMSRTGTKKFCSEQCAQLHFRRSRGVGVKTVSPPCIHNIGVLCAEHKCGRCGWNPKVELRRKEALGYG